MAARAFLAALAGALLLWKIADWLRERPADRSGNSGRYGHVFRRDLAAFGDDGAEEG